MADPLAQIGWTGETNHTRDPRVPVLCSWCLGAKVLRETVEGQPPWVLMLVVCRASAADDEVRIERRRR